VILAGRGTNDDMAAWCARAIHDWHGRECTRILVLGLAFKPDVPDLRNSKVADLIAAFCSLGHHVDVYDPLVSTQEARHEYGIDLVSAPTGDTRYDLVVLAVPHRTLVEKFDRFAALLGDKGGVADLKNALAGVALPDTVEKWTM
jgi:UDP-N-acetyl-D-galactosamine dehydrogenase